MNAKRWRSCLRIAVLTVPFLALTSCVVSDAPLGDVLKAEPDIDLVGAWQEQDVKEDTRIVVIGRHVAAVTDLRDPRPVPSGIMVYRQMSWNEKDRWLDTPDDPQQGAFFVTKVNGVSYANLFPAEVVHKAVVDGNWDAPKDTQYQIFKYRVEKNTLKIWAMNGEKTAAAVDKGKLKGKVSRNGSDYSVELTDIGALRKFLTDGGDRGLFPDEPALYRRMKLVPAE